MPVSVVCCSHAISTNADSFTNNGNYTGPAFMHLLCLRLFFFLACLVVGISRTMPAISLMFLNQVKLLLHLNQF